MVISPQKMRDTITTAVTTSATNNAWRIPPSTPAMPRSAPGIWTPTNTQSEPLSRKVAMSQKAEDCSRERARMTTGPA